MELKKIRTALLWSLVIVFLPVLVAIFMADHAMCYIGLALLWQWFGRFWREIFGGVPTAVSPLEEWMSGKLIARTAESI